jgi:hypothetical protein
MRLAIASRCKVSFAAASGVMKTPSVIQITLREVGDYKDRRITSTPAMAAAAAKNIAKYPTTCCAAAHRR